MDASLSPKADLKTGLRRWLDERLGLEEILAFARHKTVPEHRHSFWYYWGGVSLFFFLIQALTGVLLLLPTFLSVSILVIHFLCVLAKASDEESYLLTVHGEEYREYLSRTGRLFPKWIRRGSPPK